MRKRKHREISRNVRIIKLLGILKREDWTGLAATTRAEAAMREGTA
jgi:hypothetical protein